MYEKYGKRCLDLTLVCFSLILILPIFLLAFIIIYLGDKTPFFYLQERVGKHGKIFYIYKLRTMIKNADKEGTVSFKNDKRIFYGGAFLRKFKIDELAQIINVIKGDMSIVGPRPTVKEDYNKMNQIQKTRTDVLPGLTGLVQISGNTNLQWPRRIEYDLEYMKNITFMYDMKIIWLTFFKIMVNKIDSNPPSSGEW